ncbi:hypothetical protein MXF29_18785 [Pseudomonas sp. NC26]|uniref:Uncharacterized protein n=1 Tax=Pseudomonas putida TaxID=303 RepID=A0A7W2QK88_PSEPU|nr:MULTISPECIES: hypothetical protein [Pseudomonas]MBA6117642.1 hypothetical protein [Pseudomonas putida]MCZ9636195.1 hypothetical protein [Pseudomonas putida]MEC4877639.1 hypothetical protein [Pseudomonas sp. NC26]PZQ36300.1 MAG: hypothetical protein DI560_25175 [Pseudomonas putida]QNL89563.1 Uncharacterized protein PPKH_4149 [Pseudomonas putida]
MTLLTQPAPLHRHVDHETGTILHTDPISGEVIRHKDVVRPANLDAQYQAWAAERRADESLSEDHQKAAKGLSSETQGQPQETPSDEPKRGRGRQKTTYANPVAAYMYLLAIPDPLPWVDDIVTGSIITSAGVTNGKINVKARAVIDALFLSEITADACKTNEYSLRTAQRIAKAARHAAHGIASYVERHPDIKAEIVVEVGAEALFRGLAT